MGDEQTAGLADGRRDARSGRRSAGRTARTASRGRGRGRDRRQQAARRDHADSRLRRSAARRRDRAGGDLRRRGSEPPRKRSRDRKATSSRKRTKSRPTRTTSPPTKAKKKRRRSPRTQPGRRVLAPLAVTAEKRENVPCLALSLLCRRTRRLTLRANCRDADVASGLRFGERRARRDLGGAHLRRGDVGLRADVGVPAQTQRRAR